MANNVAITAGSGTTVATDEAGSAHYQVVKLADGTEDSTTRIVAGGGVEASALRVTIASDSTGVLSVDDNGASLTVDNAGLTSLAGAIAGTEVQVDIVSSALPTGAATLAEQQSQTTALQIIDDWDETDRAKVNIIVGQAGVAAGAGAVGATVPRVTLASDDPGVALLGTIDADTGNIATSVGVMDDWDNGASDGASVSGDVAHDTADAGEPVKIGARATTGLSGATMVADADRVNAVADVDGGIVTRPYCPLPDAVSGNASNTDGSSTQVIAAQAAGVRTYVTTAILTNTSSSNIYVELKDGTTVMATIPVPATGGAVVTFPVPLRGTAATAWNYDPSAATTTTYCTLVGFKSKV